MFVICVFAVVLYGMATFEEWFFHRFMHMNIDGRVQMNHKNHHKHTNPQFLVELSHSDDICFDVRNIDDVLQLFVFWIFNTIMLYLLFTPYISLFICSSSCLGTLLYNIFVWNTYHAYIHGLCASEICFMKGISYQYVPVNNWYSLWIIRNHQLHHKYPKKNYNIIFPGADYILGTNIDDNNIQI